MPGESFIQLPPNSTGLKAHTFQRTIGANAVEDEVVIQGEQYLASYTVGPNTTGQSTATANSHLLQIMAGATNKVRIRRIEMVQVALATTAVLMGVYLYRLTTAGTGGTVYTPVALDPADGAAGATAMALPTVKGTEGALIAYGEPYIIQTVNASTPMLQPVLVWDFSGFRSKSLVIAAGVTNGIAFKNSSAVAVASVMFTIWFDESSF